MCLHISLHHIPFNSTPVLSSCPAQCVSVYHDILSTLWPSLVQVFVCYLLQQWFNILVAARIHLSSSSLIPSVWPFTLLHPYHLPRSYHLITKLLNVMQMTPNYSMEALKGRLTKTFWWSTFFYYYLLLFTIILVLFSSSSSSSYYIYFFSCEVKDPKHQIQIRYFLLHLWNLWSICFYNTVILLYHYDILLYNHFMTQQDVLKFPGFLLSFLFLIRI